MNFSKVIQRTFLNTKVDIHLVGSITTRPGGHRDIGIPYITVYGFDDVFGETKLLGIERTGGLERHPSFKCGTVNGDIARPFHGMDDWAARAG